ncbi:SRPBCC family protein [Nonomuraea turcica]|uniref:SRPBCC family protein n=1 Tax=Nonomuraea sp. G32 TaxID=3067274 RepID=UPI00273C3C50|nr:SRPBCC family protein [Nonomuraea sp. G32]MDP4511886.1 SRPBCC family protein [Nonomuraea sp. G32]
MKYTTSIERDLPREKVVQLISDPPQMPKWLRGLVLHEPVNGVHGQLGTTSRVIFGDSQSFGKYFK